MIGQAVFEQLRATTGVTNLCRWIYPQVIPQDREPPAIVYSVQGIERDRVLTGEGSYNKATVVLDVYTPDYAKSQAIADAIETALVDYRGQLGRVATGIDCDHVRTERRFDIFETSTELHRVSLQFVIGYED